MVQSVSSFGTDMIRTSAGKYVEENSAAARSMKRSGQLECETCSNRKYKDGSDENVSFKAASHISPESAASRVRAHEQEHVSNAYSEAAKKGGKVIQASVKLNTSVCPECGRNYVSGGLTTTRIKFDDNTVFGANIKNCMEESFKGNNVDERV